MAARKPSRLVALSTFEAEVDGATVLVHAGDTVASGSPLAAAREALFVPAADYVQEAGTPPAP